jgi:hypothetical protein
MRSDLQEQSESNHFTSIKKRTTLSLDGCSLPALWRLDDLQPPLWWADWISCVPMENGMQAVVVHGRTAFDSWAIHLRSDSPSAERWFNNPEDHSSAEIRYAKSEKDALDVVRTLATLPSPKPLRIRSKTLSDLHV